MFLSPTAGCPSQVKAAAEGGSFVLTLGGDHSVGCGTVAGVLAARPDTGVIWVDAHADINTPLTSGSGNMHGMPLGLLMRLAGSENLPGFDWLKNVPLLKPSQVTLLCGSLNERPLRPAARCPLPLPPLRKLLPAHLRWRTLGSATLMMVRTLPS